MTGNPALTFQQLFISISATISLYPVLTTAEQTPNYLGGYFAMEKKNFVTLIMSTIGGILFALGMCMCLLSEWNAFNQGLNMGAAGLLVLVVMIFVRRKMEGKPAIHLTAKAVGTVILGIVGSLILGVGMCMCMVWEGLMIQGILVGIVGIVLLLCLIPICKGLK